MAGGSRAKPPPHSLSLLKPLTHSDPIVRIDVTLQVRVESLKPFHFPDYIFVLIVTSALLVQACFGDVFPAPTFLDHNNIIAIGSVSAISRISAIGAFMGFSRQSVNFLRLIVTNSRQLFRVGFGIALVIFKRSRSNSATLSKIDNCADAAKPFGGPGRAQLIIVFQQKFRRFFQVLPESRMVPEFRQIFFAQTIFSADFIARQSHQLVNVFLCSGYFALQGFGRRFHSIYLRTLF